MLSKKAQLLFVILLFIAGCSILPREQSLLSALEKLVEYEEEFNKQQKSLVELEKKEKEIYDRVMSLGMKQFSEISRLSKEALKIIEKREKRIKKEYDSIQMAKKQLEAVKTEISLLSDQLIKEDASHLVGLLEKRYMTYDELYNYYQQALQLEIDLYRMFQNEQLTLEQLEQQVVKINSAYHQIKKANEQFNRYTVQYNEEKKALFEKLK
ncbi:putative cell-wall binding lipoprotein [Anoxybacillus vitaminiphilus]|uniref:Putative cell-wall binding lipoprotein n=1 Tax=Paranoxybacillus vitaminiphilus TaxID=581036 RepID=A0A327YQI2_9BACL|nr:YkyA family protein [Anoxybacillus vitaminiphilus]RAK23200.1 putative cell-wall binding lipoprotein [Anoxybacillus vitaminiphilus]